jgi:putative FmdB family regulatory protein
MAIYARRCTQCSHTFEDVAPIGQGHTIKCEKCQAATEWNVQAQRVAVKSDTLVGSRSKSLEFRCAPHEVDKLRRMFGEEGAGDSWKTNGSVEFATRADAKRFFKQHERLKAAKRERQAAAGVEVDEE